MAEVTREVLDAVGRLAGPVDINPAPQEVPWAVRLDQDTEHATYETDQAATYFAAATQAALVLAEFRAPYRGRSTPVNAWWGTFHLAVSFFSGRPAPPPSDDFIMRNSGNAEQIAVGWCVRLGSGAGREREGQPAAGQLTPAKICRHGGFFTWAGRLTSWAG